MHLKPHLSPYTKLHQQLHTPYKHYRSLRSHLQQA
ncbi:hypothetical protein E2C01_094236 [Portunus trituberculatus]|uniref:Uncharacterized protein n=1 Tax=Portunus trituberculatus TaxID=210409 RepID=A0A5B7JLC4_PORTR|nr:hypothetical protein [Portunus trituberculatus]